MKVDKDVTSPAYRLGIRVGVNGAPSREYLFDTGAPMFSIATGYYGDVAWFPNRWNALTTYPYRYNYGNFAFDQQNAHISSIQFYGNAGSDPVGSYAPAEGFSVAAIIGRLDNEEDLTAAGDQGVKVGDYYLNLSWQQRINQGLAPDIGGFYGIFGAGDFVPNSKLTSPSPLGMLTSTGYIVEANGTPGAPGGCGQACLILGLTPALRAQFLSVVPWISTAENPNYLATFPVSGANAAQQFDTMFSYTYGDGYTATLPTLFDTGAPEIFINDDGLAKHSGGTLTIAGTSPGAQPFSVANAVDPGDPSNRVNFGEAIDGVAGGTSLFGIYFFLHNAVMYDLENKATAYTPFYVTEAPITTDFVVTKAMGPLGLAGEISGAGAFTVTSGGVANLSGSNTYTGPTNVGQGAWLGLAGPGSIASSSGVRADGTFDISRASSGVVIQALSGTGTVSLGANTLELGNASGSFDGQLADGGLGGGTGGGLIIAGGRQSLTGVNTYTGRTGIGQHAMLDLAGSIAGSMIDAGVLSGHGRVGGDLAVTGLIAPGGMGTYQALSVGGNYSQAAGATYVAQWDPLQPGVSSQILVGGNAALADGAVVKLISSGGQVFTPGSRYTLLTAGQGVNGTYTLLGNTSLSAVLSLKPVYDAHHFYLEVAQRRSLPSFAQTRNQAGALAGVQSLAGHVSEPNAADAAVSYRQIDAALPLLDTPFALLANMQSDAQIRYAADQLSGEIYASVKSTFLEDSRFVRDAITTRLYEAGADGQGHDTSSSQSVRTHPSGVATWGQFVGSWGRNDGDANHASLSHTLGGFFAGADTAVGGNTRIGLMGGFTQSSMNSARRGSRASSSNAHLGIYAGTQWGGLGLSLGAAYARQDFKADRSILFANYAGSTQGSGNAYTAQVFGEAAYRFQFNALALEPFLRGAYVRLNTNGSQERGGMMALSISGDRSALAYSTLGARASSRFDLNGDAFEAHASLGWRRAFGNVQPEASLAFAKGSPFSVVGILVAHNALAVDTGLDLHVNKQATISLVYNGQLSLDAVDSGFKGGFTWQFE
nr:autotransporter domain-containing protein [Dyella acidiphila]